MVTVGQLIAEAMGLPPPPRKLARGEVYRLPSSLWSIYDDSGHAQHPGLVCHPVVRSFAPGTSQTERSEEERQKLGCYELKNRNAPNKKPSIFFMKQRIDVEESDIGDHWWTLTHEDLLAIDNILGQERKG
jgi:hypothetical protein